MKATGGLRAEKKKSLAGGGSCVRDRFLGFFLWFRVFFFKLPPFF